MIQSSCSSNEMKLVFHNDQLVYLGKIQTVLVWKCFSLTSDFSGKEERSVEVLNHGEYIMDVFHDKLRQESL